MEVQFQHLVRLATLQLSLVITILFLAVAPTLAAPTPETIECYLHGFGNLTSDITNVTAFTILPAVTPTLGVGRTMVARETLTAEPNISSQVLGTMNALLVETGVGPQYSSVLLIATVLYDDGQNNGSIALQGVANFNVDPNFVAVMGGTGDFLGVQGYALRESVSSEVVGNLLHTVVQFNFYLFYADATCEQGLEALAGRNLAKTKESQKVEK